MIVKQGRRFIKVGTNLQCLDQWAHETYNAVGDAVFVGVKALQLKQEDPRPVDMQMLLF